MVSLSAILALPPRSTPNAFWPAPVARSLNVPCGPCRLCARTATPHAKITSRRGAVCSGSPQHMMANNDGDIHTYIYMWMDIYYIYGGQIMGIYICIKRYITTNMIWRSLMMRIDGRTAVLW